ncbi:unnamed protein product [Rotaria socialis]|uniref:Uncharacterized protein n=1 Tax=Rotaria socialis TaxID=392032 RepID=A0A820SXY8_9BILA|nr:unnamed protein product [Rotaria socialis]
MMSNSGIMPHRTNMTNINQMDGDSVSATIPTTEQNTNSTRNAAKRPKQGDDSFELEHRVVNIHNQSITGSFLKLYRLILLGSFEKNVEKIIQKKDACYKDNIYFFGI